MGFNTTVIVLNDALHDIEGDPQFGKKLVEAIMHASLGRDAQRFRLDVSAGCHCNAATVIESHHASGNAIVAVGGNCGSVLGHTYGNHHEDENKVDILRQLADQLGYSIRKKPNRSK